MSKSRFKGRRSALKPEWILDSSPSGSVTPTPTSGLQSRPTSSMEQKSSMESDPEHDKVPEESAPPRNQADSTARTSTPPAKGPIQATPSPGARPKGKSRYSKSHTSNWTMPSSPANRTEEGKRSPRGADSKLKSWFKRLKNEAVPQLSTDKPLGLPSPRSAVPPAPTQPNFTSVPPPMRSHKVLRNNSVPSPSGSADAPPKPPYIASNYTPTQSPMY